MQLKRWVPNKHELTKVEVTFRFLYMVRDLGVKSAHGPAVHYWKMYSFMLSEIKR